MKKLPGTAASFTAAWGFWGAGRVLRGRAAHLETQQARFRGLAGATVHGAGNDSGAGAFRVDRGSGAQADAVGGQVRRGKIGSDAAKAAARLKKARMAPWLKPFVFAIAFSRRLERRRSPD